MSFDNSRVTFDPWKDYSAVVMEQGRVQLDADWNDWVAELARRIQAGTLDVFGHAAYPPTTPWAFLITATAGATNTVTIGPGRLYVDGLMAENHGAFKTASWDPALAELSNSPQPPDLTHANPDPLDFTQQRYLPGATLPTDLTQSYVFYLDVWVRDVDYLQDPDLVDKAVAVDTTARLQTVWQVKWMVDTGGWTCATPDSQIFPPRVLGLLTTDTVANASAGPCCLTDNTGYTGVENQLYRVAIHQAGVGSDPASGGGALFKWSRDNGSVETGVLGISVVQNSINQPASALTVTSLGRDEVLGFKAGDWVELLDDWSELWGQAGVLCQIDSVNVSPPTIILTTTVSTGPSSPSTGASPTFPVDANGKTDATRHTRIRRWDQSGKVYDTNGNLWCDVKDFGGAIPVPASGTTLVLESGITVDFQVPSGGSFGVGDYWVFAARTADGDIEKLRAAPPRGIHHHYTKLSIVTFGPPATSTDCRTPSGGQGPGGCGCCTVTVGDGVNSIGQFSTIQAAINALPANGGEVCILPGRYFEYVTLDGLTDVVIYGCGGQTRIASPSLQPTPVLDAAKKATAKRLLIPSSGLSAVITASEVTNLTIRNLAVEADDGDVGILLDGQVFLEGAVRKQAAVKATSVKSRIDAFLPIVFVRPTNFNVTLSDLALTASTLPALVAVRVDNLDFTKNRVAMADVLGQWPAVWVSGSELHVDHNWLGLQDDPDAANELPQVVVNEVPGFSTDPPDTTLANGGIQIGAPSRDVYVLDNQIQGGLRNGITLGAFRPQKGASSGKVFGLLPTMPTQETPVSLILSTESHLGPVISAGRLLNVHISRNRIRNVGLCGVGPVGFFNLSAMAEVITAKNVVISDNVISGSLQAEIETRGNSIAVGYGAICLADVENLIVRDNLITDFGNLPGAPVCGVFVLLGEQVTIDRNQVIETRDWSTDRPQAETNGAFQAGILVMLVTPPALSQAGGSAWTSSFAQGGDAQSPFYQPGLPALRIENNVVRVPIGYALEVFGWGPFSIVGNHLSSGGTVPLASFGDALQAPAFLRQTVGVSTVLILNLGLLIEARSSVKSFADLYTAASNPGAAAVAGLPASPTNGTVLFSNNICQLEARVSLAQTVASVGILTLDHLLFSGNQLWLDGGEQTAGIDAFLFGFTLQANGNRFQEAPSSVAASALTYGFANVTTGNLASYCLYVFGNKTNQLSNVILDSSLCEEATIHTMVAKNRSLAQVIPAADAVASQRAQSLSLVHRARLAQVTRTAADVTAQYGASSPQARTAQAGVAASAVTVGQVAALNERLSLRAPTASATGWSLYGHVYDSALQPAVAHTVFIVDATNAYQSAIGFAYTGSDGSYRINYAPPASGATLPAQLFLQVANAQGQPVYLGTTALRPPAGAATLTDITLPAGEPVIGDPPAALRGIAFPPTGSTGPAAPTGPTGGKT